MALLASTAEKHRYQTCRDEWCELPYCRIYKEGYSAGYGAGYSAGYADGRAEGFEEGFSAGCSAGEASAG